MMLARTYRFLHFRPVLSERKTDVSGNFFPVSVVVFNAYWQVKTISLQDVLENIGLLIYIMRKTELRTRTCLRGTPPLYALILTESMTAIP